MRGVNELRSYGDRFVTPVTVFRHWSEFVFTRLFAGVCLGSVNMAVIFHKI